LAQFAGITDDIAPLTVLEHVYAVFIGFGAYIVSLVLLSTLTSSLTQTYIIGGSGARQVATLKMYLRQNRISKNLMKRLCRNATHAISGDLTADAVDLLGVISEPLKVQMHFEMYSRFLFWHPFFMDLCKDDVQVMKRLCHQAMSMLLMAASDSIFFKGEDPADPKMYFVVAGNLEYTDSYGATTEVREKQWLCEAVLWTEWRHRGTLTAQSDVKLATLNADIFHKICKRLLKEKNPQCLLILRYASEFVAELNKEEYPMDLWGC
jgi:hypothetical protein